MSAEKKYTERDLVLAQREAFFCGYENAVQGWGQFHSFTPNTNSLARREYPLPKVERPRVMRDRYHEWRVRDAVLEWRLGKSTDWKAADFTQASHGSVLYPTPARIALWADLFANPTELVDDDGAEDGV